MTTAQAITEIEARHRADEIVKLKAACREVLRLVYEKILTQNTDFEHDFKSYTEQSDRIMKLIRELQELTE